MATIRDVSAAAGVSVKTVSRVLNGSPEVADETRQRVSRAIADLDFRPSALAQRLASGKTNTVGLVIPRDANYVFSHLYFNDVLRGIGEALDGHGYDLLVHIGHDSAPYIELLQQRHVDGLILMSIPLDHPHLEGLLEGGYPCVFTCRFEEENAPVHWVDTDTFAGSVLAVDHLTGLGHQRIGLIGGPQNLLTAQLQVRGYYHALAAHSLEGHPDWIAQGDYTAESGQTIASSMLGLTAPPTALICGDDMTALGAIMAARDAGLRVPEDVSIVGFDDIILARYGSPPLTTIRQDSWNKGFLAAQTLLEVLGKSAPASPRQILLPVELITRGSTGPIRL